MEFYGEDFLREEKLYKQSLLSEAKEFGHIVSRDNDLVHILTGDRYRLTCDTPEKFFAFFFWVVQQYSMPKSQSHSFIFAKTTELSQR